MKRVVVLDDYQRVALDRADWGVLDGRASVDIIDHHIAEQGELISLLRDYEIIVAMRERTAFPGTLLEKLPLCELLVTTGPFNAAIDMAAAAEHGITVCGTGGILPPAMEHTWALILACAKRICECDRTLKNGGWQSAVGADLSGARLGLVGLGRYGAQVATVARAFEMDVVAWSQNLTAERCASVGGVRLASKEELLSTSDFISIHLVLSSRTRGIIGDAELSMMKPTAYLVNTSRGAIIDESALVRALQECRIVGAGLDVFETEPLPETHPLRRLDNAILTPHMGYVTQRCYEVFFSDVVEDIDSYLDGNPVRKLVAG